MLRALAAAPQAVDLLQQFTSILIGDSSTLPLPEELADSFPGCGGKSGNSAQAALKIHLLWDFLIGSILQLRITAGAHSDATNPDRPEVPPAGSLSLFDLGYFALDRFAKLAQASAFWISRLQHRTSVFYASRPSLAPAAILAAADRPRPIDLSVLLSVTHRLPCRLIALRVPQEVADRRRQKVHEKA